ncbi:MAG: erythromycin esterase family protein, partial [Holophagae bacterium]
VILLTYAALASTFSLATSPGPEVAAGVGQDPDGPSLGAAPVAAPPQPDSLTPAVGELLGDGVPYTVWAHDSHVATNPHYSSNTGSGSMGSYITRRLGADYVRIATAFTRGTFVAVQADWRGRDTAPMICRIDEDPPSDSINALLDRASSNRYLLPLRGIPTGSPLNRFLDAERPMLGVGDFFAGATEPHYHSPERILRLIDAYDAVFYFSDTRGVRPLSPAGSP